MLCIAIMVLVGVIGFTFWESLLKTEWEDDPRYDDDDDFKYGMYPTPQRRKKRK